MNNSVLALRKIPSCLSAAVWHIIEYAAACKELFLRNTGECPNIPEGHALVRLNGELHWVDFSDTRPGKCLVIVPGDKKNAATLKVTEVRAPIEKRIGRMPVTAPPWALAALRNVSVVGRARAYR